MSDISMHDRILDAAEGRARRGGYHAFSFRELADDIGVKSSSIHYHFPTKPMLAEALAHRYAARARARLGDAAGLSADDAVTRVTALFRDALVKDDRMCLCGIFGAERDALPPAVDAAVASFFPADPGLSAGRLRRQAPTAKRRKRCSPGSKAH